MTFPEQILGVPPALIEQGFRLYKTLPRGLWDAWVNQDNWFESIGINGINVCRPMRILKGCGVYDHAGWGDGMSPTPEMCKVWRYWWVDIGNGPRVKDCEVVEYERTPERYWLGPVLPPVRQS